MTTNDVLTVLSEFHHERLALRERHVAVARHVANYEFNNTYQYIISREDTHLAWLEAAIGDLGGTPDRVEPVVVAAPGKREGAGSLIARDADDMRQFVERWRPRVADVSHARHRLMMQVVLGEMLEEKRFFDQMIEGRDDLLGRRTGGPRTGDGVLKDRWVS